MINKVLTRLAEKYSARQLYINLQMQADIRKFALASTSFMYSGGVRKLFHG